MKKWITCFFTVCLLAVALSVTAFAAGTVETVTGGTAVLTKNGTDKVDVKYDSAESGKEYLVLATNVALNLDKLSEDLTAEKIVYIDQKTAGANGVEFTINPKELKTQSYYVYMSSNATGGGIGTLAQVGTYTAKGPAYKLGDVNDDKKVTTTDAVWILQNTVKGRDFTDVQKSAADVNGDTKVSTTDAVWILQYTVKGRDENFNPIKK